MATKNLSSEDTQASVFPLPAALTIETVEALYASFQGMSLNALPQLVLDASQTEVLTTPAVQLLLALEKALAGHGGSLLLLHLSPELQERLCGLGLRAANDRWNRSPEHTPT